MPQQSCQRCGHALEAFDKFCTNCGTPTAVPGASCAYCGATVPGNALYCPDCGRRMGGQQQPDIQNNVWRKNPDQFAARVEPKDLRGFPNKKLEVQPGQQAVLLQDGRAEATPRGPGLYTLETLFARLLQLGGGHHTSALIIDTGYTPVEFAIPRVFTRDDREVTVRCALDLMVHKPMDFFVNVMKGGQSVTVVELRDRLSDEVRDAAQDVVGQAAFADLARGLPLKSRMAVAAEQHLATTLAAAGLKLGGVHVLEVNHPRLDALRRQWEDIEIARQQAEADQTQTRETKIAQARLRNAQWQGQLELDDQETAEARARARLYAERAEAYDAIRRAADSDKMNAVKSEEDFKDFLAGIDTRKVLRQEELDKLAEDYASRQTDRRAAAEHAGRLAAMERDYNLKQAELVWRTDFTLAQMGDALKVDQQRLADAGLLDEARWRNDLAALKRQADAAEWDRAEQQRAIDFRRRQERETQDHQGQLELARAKMQSELAAIRGDSARTQAEKDAASKVVVARYDVERQRIAHEEQLRQEAAEDEQDIKTAASALDLMKKMKENRLAAEAEARRIAREDDLTRQKAAQEAEQARRDAELRASAQNQSHELAMLQAQLAGDLKQTEALKGMSDEAVLALMAEKSPLVGQALIERQKALAAKPQESDPKLLALYDRLISQMQESARKDAETHERTTAQFQQLFEKALDSQRTGMTDIARAASGQGGQGPHMVIVPTSAGSPQVIQTSGGTSQPSTGSANKVQVCPRCRIESPVGVKFCKDCGYKFFEQ